jgi:hypothetical protein
METSMTMTKQTVKRRYLFGLLADLIERTDFDELEALVVVVVKGNGLADGIVAVNQENLEKVRQVVNEALNATVPLPEGQSGVDPMKMN